MNIKSKIKKVGSWIKEHKTIVVGTVLGTTLGVIGSKVLLNKKNNKLEEGSNEDYDYGRDCTMKFVVDETQEVLGEVPCTELFAKEEIEMFNDTVK